MLNPFFHLLENLGAGIWVGSISMLAYVVAGTIFREIPSINMAGSLNGKILRKFNQLEGVAAAMMTVSTAYFLVTQNEINTALALRAVLLVCMIGFLVFYARTLTSKMEHLRTVDIQDFDNFDSSKQKFRDEFNRLHKVYTKLVSFNLLMAVLFISLANLG
ncbi:MAG: DUF4149 domain-containing protein [Chlorobiales bacterium]|jgi:hypothetical protein|nr:DUF4149 domain-containing protein [Chlorobiales bacterium]